MAPGLLQASLNELIVENKSNKKVYATIAYLNKATQVFQGQKYQKVAIEHNESVTLKKLNLKLGYDREFIVGPQRELEKYMEGDQLWDEVDAKLSRVNVGLTSRVNKVIVCPKLVLEVSS